eukprot:m.880958 g.880958  ORF g.880958 m.880958 type:complete len:612 (+) comp23593_c0_seq30:190-2025(+)
MTMPHEPDMGLCDCATLYSSDESYWLVDNRQHATDRCVCIDRATGGVTFQESLPNTDFFDSSHRQEIHGLLGVIDLLSGPHLVVITERRRIGKIYQHMLWEVTDTAILPYARHRRHLADVQCRIEDRYLDMLSTALNTHRMYLSYTYDITHSLQNLLTNGDEFYARTLYNRMEPRFCWNQYILKGLARHPEFSRYLLPVICGFVAVSHSANVNGRNLQFTLISRRSVQRTGTRFNRRGIDRAGNVANFVETEQITQIDNEYHLAFVQVRGSIPLFWGQTPTLRYKPPIEFYPDNTASEAFRQHFQELEQRYGQQAVINLINNKGHEGTLRETFQTNMQALRSDKVAYYEFDFHKECSRMRWDRVRILLDRVRPDYNAHGAFAAHRVNDVVEVKRTQQGVFRHNCIDCLDRTNVVQSMLAKDVLYEQLRMLGILTPTETLASHQTLNHNLDNIWADNADMLAMQYGGSKALKTDFTRTGHRTLRGMLADARESLLRYYKNNFTDGFKQDALDLLLGNYRVHSTEGVASISPVSAYSSVHIRLVPLVLFLSCACLVVLLGAAEEDPLLRVVRHMAFMTGCMALLVAYFFRHRMVNLPTLLSPAQARARSGAIP